MADQQEAASAEYDAAAGAASASRGDLMKSRAAIFLEPGQPLVVDEVEYPDPGPGEVLVKNFASGICHSQLHQMHRGRPATLQTPTTWPRSS